jgi:hypothetical protein
MTEFQDHPSFLDWKHWRISLVYSCVGRSPAVTMKGVTITPSTLNVSTSILWAQKVQNLIFVKITRATRVIIKACVSKAC